MPSDEGQALYDAALRYLVTYLDDRMGGVILKQDPPEGTDAARGSAVDLVVNED